MERISLGSAPDPPTESFYVKNGYRPTSIMLRVGSEEPSEGGAGIGITPDQVVEDEEERRFYFKVDQYEPRQRVALEEAYSASAIYIFEKKRTYR